MPKNRSATANTTWYVIIGLLSVAVGCVLAVLVYLLAAPPPPPKKIVPTSTRLAFVLPTPTTLGAVAPPPIPNIKFEAQEPIQGFANCHSYGLNGKIVSSRGQPLAQVQVVVWEDDRGALLALDTSAADGAYRISINSPPTGQNVQVQLYRADRPVSEPLLLKIYVDCENGFQIYQVNWQELPSGQN